MVKVFYRNLFVFDENCVKLQIKKINYNYLISKCINL